MVSHIPTTLLLAVVIVGVSCQLTPPSQNNLIQEQQTPIAERRSFTKKLKFLPTIKKPKSINFGGWLPSFFTTEEVTEAPLVHEVSPLRQYPIWKVHKYKGIELRPVSMVEAPRYLDVPVIRGAAPNVIQLPPVKPPAVEYGVPAAEYGPPKALDKDSTTEASFAEMAVDETSEKGASEEETQSSLDALSNLGGLTSLLGEGDANTLARLQFILQLFQGGNRGLTNKIQKLKSWKKPLAAPQAAAPAPGILNGLYSLKKDHKSLLSSFVPNILRGSTPSESSIPLPALPEVAEPEVPTVLGGLGAVRIPLPELPSINLPAYTNAAHFSQPYLKVKQVPSSIPVAPVPVIQQQYYQPPVFHYNNFPNSYAGNTPLYNSYGVSIPVDSYSAAASDQAPQYAAPPASQQEQMPSVYEKENSFRNETVFVPQEQQQQQQLEEQPQQLSQQKQQPVSNVEYEDNYDMQMVDENSEMMDPRNNPSLSERY